uniref:Uncharacterized protein n=1 Tax=Lepeophtheirus salmonis TaxID=72036 RepID=A0A0K2UHE4_LEPSM
MGAHATPQLMLPFFQKKNAYKLLMYRDEKCVYFLARPFFSCHYYSILE